MLTKMLIVKWLMTLMILWAPPERRHGFIPEAQESREQAEQRYEQIAEALMDVAFDPNEEPIFGGRYGRQDTALLMLAVAYTESGFRRDVDLGLGKRARGDGGRSHCMMQINIGSASVPDADPEIAAWKGRDLTDDRRKCFRVGMHMLRRSVRACASLPRRSQLSSYTRGSCIDGDLASLSKMSMWATARKKAPLLGRDDLVTQAWWMPESDPLAPGFFVPTLVATLPVPQDGLPVPGLTLSMAQGPAASKAPSAP